MGRRKRSNSLLPQRMRLSHGAYYWVGYVEGRQKWVRLGATYSEAIAEYGRLEASRSVRTDLAALMVAFQAARFPQIAAATRKNYAVWMKQLRAVFGHMKPAEITLQDARKYLVEHPKASTARHQIALLSNLLTFGAETGWLPVNPLVGMRKGKRERRQRYMTDAEMASVLAAKGLQREHVLACRLAYLTALRIGDVLRLRWADVRDDGLHARVQKTKSQLVFDWTPALRQAIADAKAGTLLGMTLVASAGRPVKLNALYKAFKRSAEVAGVTDVTLHDLRRKRLTDLERSHGIEFARKVAAHTDIRTTAGYVVGEQRIALPG